MRLGYTFEYRCRIVFDMVLNRIALLIEGRYSQVTVANMPHLRVSAMDVVCDARAARSEGEGDDATYFAERRGGLLPCREPLDGEI